MNKYYVSLSKLGVFLDNCKNTFANTIHTHTTSDLSDISEYTDDKIANQSSEVWTFTLEDGSTVTKEMVVK